MKQFLLSSILLLLITQVIAVSNPQTESSSQPIILLGEINDQSIGAESYVPKLQPTPKFIQQQNAISNEYNQKQEAIAEEEEYMAEMEFGMFDGPFWGDDGMYNSYPDMFAGPGIMIPIRNNNNNSNNSSTTKPKMIGYYESQLQNGDILFKQ